MQLYNALTQRVEAFNPAGEKATIYVCGITPYDTTHLGHCFTYASFDILIRYLEHKGIEVRYVQNVTDIDDDILKRAGEVGQDWLTLGNEWTVHFIDDNVALNILPPDYFPRATDVLPDIVNIVLSLLEAGVAYESAGNVYFHVASDPDFGKLSRLSSEEMLPVANERGNKPDDPNKRHPLDFVLWQARSTGEPSWPSPWGPGRPGWHIECSTMSTKYLGQPIDIHGGGADLLFPHHECEIAQAEWATGTKPFTRFWVHTAMVRYQGDKMSKSLGNLVMVRDLLQQGWSADALRLYMASNHYRQPWKYRPQDLQAAALMAGKVANAATVRSGQGTTLNYQPVQDDFFRSMDNDLDTPKALDALIRLADKIIIAVGNGQDVEPAQRALRTLSAILGLSLDQGQPEERVIQGWQAHRRRFEGPS